MGIDFLLSLAPFLFNKLLILKQTLIKMKKIFFTLTLLCLCANIETAKAADSFTTTNATTVLDNFQDDADSGAETPASPGFTQELKNRFIEGGPGFMGIVLVCLILGLAIAIERIIYLNLATTNTKKTNRKCRNCSCFWRC